MQIIEDRYSSSNEVWSYLTTLKQLEAAVRHVWSKDGVVLGQTVTAWSTQVTF